MALIFLQTEPECFGGALGERWLIYIRDSEIEATQLNKPNDRHPMEPLGWAVLKTERRESAMKELQDFIAFADSWFGDVTYRTMVLYNSAA